MTSTLYALNNPPVKGSAYTFPVVLFSQADTKIIKTSPTLAAGDVLVGYEGTAPTTNIATLPTTDASGVLQVTCSTAETNHDQITVKFHDAAGAEWCDLLVTFSTVTAATVGATDGASAADVWAYTSRTLTQSAASSQLTTSAAIERARGDTWAISLTGLGSNTGYVSLDFSIKNSTDDADTAAIVRVRKNASGLNDGLLYLNGAAPVAPVVAADGSITVNSATAVTVALAARATDDLAPGWYVYDVQLITASAVTTLANGTFEVTADVTRAVS